MTRASAHRNWIAGCLVILVIAILVTVRGDPPPKVPMLNGSTITVVPGIHLLGNIGPAAAYVIETSKGLVLVDAGLDSDAGSLKSEMSKLGLDWRQLQAIFLTHVHGDHCGGAEVLRRETGATVYAGKADAPILRAGGPKEAFFSTFYMPDHTPHPTTVDVELEGHETIAIGNLSFQVLATSGHTLGSVCYLLEGNGRSVLFSGDVIMGLGDMPLGTYSAYLGPRYRGDARAFLETLRNLRALPVPDLLLPGHPRYSQGPRSPQPTRERWEEMLDVGIHELEKLVARFDADGEDFLDGQPKRLLPDLYYLGDFQNAAVYGFFANSKFFVIDAPGGAGLADFLKARLRQLGLPPSEPTAILLTACGEKETAGLNELVERSHATVIVSPMGVETVQQLCVPGTSVVSTDELPQKNWFPVTCIPLGGRVRASVAYVLRWTDRTVLFSGRIPAGTGYESQEELLSELRQSRENSLAYQAALRQLIRVHPTLWLPAAPSNDQNANLYGSSWKETLEQNYRAAQRALR